MIDQFLLFVAHLEVPAEAAHVQTADCTAIQVRATVYRLPPDGIVSIGRMPMVNQLVCADPMISASHCRVYCCRRDGGEATKEIQDG